MGKKVITTKGRVSVVKKRWYTLEAPGMFNAVQFGETPAAEPDLLKGRGININLSTLMKTGKRNNVEIHLRVTEVKGNICATEFIGMEIFPQFVKRFVKRAKKRVDDSFVVTCKDGVNVRLKPLLLVKSATQHGVMSALRMKSREYLTRVAAEVTFTELVGKILFGDAVREMKGELRKVYPVGIVEIRALVKE